MSGNRSASPLGRRQPSVAAPVPARELSRVEQRRARLQGHRQEAGSAAAPREDYDRVRAMSEFAPIVPGLPYNYKLQEAAAAARANDQRSGGRGVLPAAAAGIAAGALLNTAAIAERRPPAAPPQTRVTPGVSASGRPVTPAAPASTGALAPETIKSSLLGAPVNNWTQGAGALFKSGTPGQFGVSQAGPGALQGLAANPLATPAELAKSPFTGQGGQVPSPGPDSQASTTPPAATGIAGVQMAGDLSSLDEERRRAFMSGADSMAGMQAVRSLLAERAGVTPEQGAKMSVRGLERLIAQNANAGFQGVDATKFGVDTAGAMALPEKMEPFAPSSASLPMLSPESLADGFQHMSRQIGEQARQSGEANAPVSFYNAPLVYGSPEDIGVNLPAQLAASAAAGFPVALSGPTAQVFAAGGATGIIGDSRGKRMLPLGFRDDLPPLLKGRSIPSVAGAPGVNYAGWF